MWGLGCSWRISFFIFGEVYGEVIGGYSGVIFYDQEMEKKICMYMWCLGFLMGGWGLWCF